MFEIDEPSQTERFELRRIRTVPETVNMTFDFIRAHFRLISRSLLLITFPPVLVALALFYAFFINMMALLDGPSWMGGNEESVLASFALVILGGSLLLTIASSMIIGVVHVIVELYMDGGPDGFETVTVQDVWNGVKVEFWRLLGTNFALGILYVIVALLANLIPFVGSFGLWILLVFGALYYPIRIYERRGLFRSFTISADLVQGKWWATLGLGLLHYTMTLTLSSLLMLPLFIILILEAFGIIAIERMIASSPWIVHVGGVVVSLYIGLLILLWAIPILSLIFHYYSQRERKNGIGLMAEAERIGTDWSEEVTETTEPGDRAVPEAELWNDRLRNA